MRMRKHWPSLGEKRARGGSKRVSNYAKENKLDILEDTLVWLLMNATVLPG